MSPSPISSPLPAAKFKPFQLVRHIHNYDIQGTVMPYDNPEKADTRLVIIRVAWVDSGNKPGSELLRFWVDELEAVEGKS